MPAIEACRPAPHDSSLATLDRAETAACPRYSPLVLHGPTGTGKSHLVATIADAWRRTHGIESVYVFTAVDFARAMHDAQENAALDVWREQYRSVRLLVIEDLEGLLGRTAAQVELMHALDELWNNEAQALITVRTPLHELKDLLPGLASRLQRGLVVPLVSPGPQCRYELLQLFVRERGLDVSDESLECLARSLTGPVQELYGAVQTLYANGMGLGLDAVRTFVERRREVRTPSLRTIAAAAARQCGVRMSELRGPSRRRGAVEARDVAMYVARELTPLSLERIGQYFGGRDHTTVSHGVQKIAGLLTTDVETRRMVERLREALTGASAEPAKAT